LSVTIDFKTCYFNPRLPGGRRLNVAGFMARNARFQSTPSGGKATDQHGAFNGSKTFQSTPSGGKATGPREVLSGGSTFQSTPSGGKATGHNGEFHQIVGSFNPRLPGGRRQG